MIPVEFLEPVLETMRLLVEHYRVTFVICTATQPVFERRKDFPGFPGLPEGSIREIVQDVSGLYKVLKRVEVAKEILNVPEWGDLADEL